MAGIELGKIGIYLPQSPIKLFLFMPQNEGHFLGSS